MLSSPGSISLTDSYNDSMRSVYGHTACKRTMYGTVLHIGLGSGFYFVKTHVEMDRVAANVCLLSNVSEFNVLHPGIGVVL